MITLSSYSYRGQTWAQYENTPSHKNTERLFFLSLITTTTMIRPSTSPTILLLNFLPDMEKQKSANSIQ